MAIAESNVLISFTESVNVTDLASLQPETEKQKTDFKFIYDSGVKSSQSRRSSLKRAVKASEYSV